MSENAPTQTSFKDSEKFKYISSLSKIAGFFFAGLSIFFISGFMIVKASVSSKRKHTVPDVIGKMYLDEHNVLRDSFRVEIERVFSVNYPFGYVVSQSISPGKVVDQNTKLVLLVNQSEAVIKTPKLVGLSEDLVDGILSNQHIGGRTYKLNKGIQTRIPAAQPKGEVLSQFPPEGTPVVPGYPVSLLVSEGPGNLKASLKLEGVHVEIAKAVAYHMKTPLKIQKKEVNEDKQNGVVLENDLKPGESFVATVGAMKEPVPANDENEFDANEQPYRLYWVKHSRLSLPEGAVTTALVKTDKTDKTSQSFENRHFLQNVAGDELPVFQQSNTKHAYWKSYYGEQEAPASEKKETAPENAKALVDKPVETKPETKPTAPDGYFKLRSKLL